MTAPRPVDPHVGRDCRICHVPLTAVRPHCDHPQCPWCDACPRARHDEGKQRTA